MANLSRLFPILTYVGMTGVSALSFSGYLLMALFGEHRSLFEEHNSAAMLVVILIFPPLLIVSVGLVVVMIGLLSVGQQAERKRVLLWSGLAVLTFLVSIVSTYLSMIGSTVAGGLSLWWWILEVRSTPQS